MNLIKSRQNHIFSDCSEWNRRAPMLDRLFGIIRVKKKVAVNPKIAKLNQALA